MNDYPIAANAETIRLITFSASKPGPRGRRAAASPGRSRYEHARVCANEGRTGGCKQRRRLEGVGRSALHAGRGAVVDDDQLRATEEIEMATGERCGRVVSARGAGQLVVGIRPAVA